MDIYNDKNLRSWLDQNVAKPYSFAKYLNKALNNAENGKPYLEIPRTSSRDGKKKEYYFSVKLRDDGEVMVEF